MRLFIVLSGILFTITTTLFSQTAPVASNVKILGEAMVNTSTSQSSTLTGYYDYFDAEGDAEGSSVYQWYRDGSAISGATNIRYTIQSTDVGSTITFSVTPIDIEPRTGTIVYSSGIIATSVSYTDYTVASNATYGTSFSPATTHWLNGSTNSNSRGITVYSGTTLIIHGDLDLSNVNSSFDLWVVGTLIIEGKLITKNNVNITVNGGASFDVLSGLNAKNGSDISVVGTFNITGNVTVQGNTNISVSGGAALSVDGNLDIGNNATVNVTGVVDVTGNLDTGSGSTIYVNGGASVDVGGNLIGNAIIDGYGPVNVAGSVDPNINDAAGSGSQIVSGGTLPISLIAFDAYTKESAIEITWSTATEKNNHFFTIERSVDGVDFEIIGTTAGAGNSLTQTDYSFTDLHPLQGTTYYRLKQTDFDGQYEYFNTVSVTFYNEAELQIYPNPATTELTIDFGGLTAESSIQILNIYGQVVKSLSVWQAVQTIDVSDLVPGNYLLTIINGNQPLVKQIVIQ